MNWAGLGWLTDFSLGWFDLAVNEGGVELRFWGCDWKGGLDGEGCDEGTGEGELGVGVG